MEQTLELLLGDFRAGKKELNRLFFIGLFFALATHFVESTWRANENGNNQLIK